MLATDKSNAARVALSQLLRTYKDVLGHTLFSVLLLVHINKALFSEGGMSLN